MFTKLRNIVLLTLLGLIFVLFVSLELSLFAKDIYYNKFSAPSITVDRVRRIDSETFNVEIKAENVNNIDLKNSYVVLIGSKYIFNKNLDDYSYLTDRRREFSRVYFNEFDKVSVDFDNNAITVVDNNAVTPQYGVISEYFVQDKQGNIDHLWQINTFYKDPYIYFLFDRFSFLFQNVMWFFAIFGFFNLKDSFSTVYDSKTKKPIYGAIARIYKDGKLAFTSISNIAGLISLRFPKGRYKAQIIKQGYTFPSSLKPLSNDVGYPNLNYGDEINVAKDNTMFQVNFPLDPQDFKADVSTLQTIQGSTLTILNSFNPNILLIVTVIQIVMWPFNADTLIYVIVALLLFASNYLVKRATKPGFGSVVDQSGKPLSGINFQVYDAEWNKLVTTLTTNEKGLYEALLQPKQYYIKIVNPGLQIKGRDAEGKYFVKGRNINNILNVTEKIVLEAAPVVSNPTQPVTPVVPQVQQVPQTTNSNPTV